MHIGVYSPRPEILNQIKKAAEDLNSTAHLNLYIHEYGCFEELTTSITCIPLDFLFYDTQIDSNPIGNMRQVAHTLPKCAMIIVCDDARHALLGYSVRAVDYLITPLLHNDLINFLSKCIRERLVKNDLYLSIKINGVWAQVGMKSITYMESSGHTMIFHLNDGRELRNISHYRDYQDMLNLNPDYFRCHKSYVVNMHYVKDYDPNAFTLYDGTSVNISRPYRQAARSMYATYITQTTSNELEFINLSIN